MAQTEPLPFVPATWMTLQGRAISRSPTAAWKPPLLGNSVEQPLDIFEIQLNAEALQAVQPGERLLVIQTRARCHIHRVAAK